MTNRYAREGPTLEQLEHNNQDLADLPQVAIATYYGREIYSPLGAFDIRLVIILPGKFDDTIELRINTANLCRSPVYDALSYVWHPRDGTINISAPSRTALVTNHGSCPILLGANLDAAIRHLRPQQGPPLILWIDALCINQEVAKERNHQVGLMKRIYSSAHRVFIWLDPHRYCSDFVLNISRSGKLEKQDTDDFISCLEILLQRDWFGRVWIAQELTLAREDPIVHLGNRKYNWKAFAHSLNLVSARLRGDGHLYPSMPTTYLNCLRKAVLPSTLQTSALIARIGCVQNLADLRNAGPLAKFSERFVRTMYLQASEPRDKVYGLLGFSSWHDLAISPDYTKSAERVLAEAAAVIMEQDLYSYIAFQLWEYQKWRLYEHSLPSTLR